MRIENLPAFPRMMVGAVLGAAAGIIFGLIFSLAIAWLANQISTGPRIGTPNGDYGFSSFLGMGAGAIVGSIFGAGTYLNKKQ